MREVIDATENHYGNLLVDFLVDSNVCMLNGRVGNNDNFTCVSKKGRSVVDYVLIPHGNLPSVSDFKVNMISDLINIFSDDVPEKRPDHSLLEWKLSAVDTNAPDSAVDDNESKPKHFNMAKLKADFLSDESCANRINETIIRIENELTSNKCINESYNNFVDFLINEMDIAGLTAGYQSQRSKSAKSLYKPYWNDLL